ncbi:hypothetical protein ACFQ46_04175 [Kineococcus sp. GCM10028916]|uniref:hypothetical protein n=1 Tax=Kineococcus sp. GCM10028916 TaxID=3273394 RepID=UPI00363218EF
MGAGELQVRAESPGGPVGHAVRARFWAEAAAVTGLALGDGPPASDLTDLVAPSGAFVVAVRDGEPLGCVGVRELAGGDVEVKRLFVVPAGWEWDAVCWAGARTGPASAGRAGWCWTPTVR